MLFTGLQKLSLYHCVYLPTRPIAQPLNLKSDMHYAQLVSQRDACTYLLNVLKCLRALLSKPFVTLSFNLLNH